MLAAGLAVGLVGVGRAQSWVPLKNLPSVGVTNPLLLTDGTVIVQAIFTPDWWRLTPDEYGNYANGTWSQIASMPGDYAPLFYASAVLPDGRVIVEGGEFLCGAGCGDSVWSNRGAIYDPVANRWTAVAPPPGWTGIGDAASVVLANGTLMLATCCGPQNALLNAKTLTWTLTGKNKADSNNEEGWTLLPNGLVLTVDTGNPSDPTNSEVYAPSTGRGTAREAQSRNWLHRARLGRRYCVQTGPYLRRGRPGIPRSTTPGPTDGRRDRTFQRGLPGWDW